MSPHSQCTALIFSAPWWPVRLWLALLAGALAGLRAPPACHRVDGHDVEYRANVLLVEHGRRWHHGKEAHDG